MTSHLQGFESFRLVINDQLARNEKKKIFDRFQDAAKPHKAPRTAVVRVEIGKHGQQYASMNPISMQRLSEQNIAP